MTPASPAASVARALRWVALLALGLGTGLATAQAPGGTSGNIFRVTPVGAGAATAVGGSVIPKREVTLAAQLPGRVEFLAGSEGDRFEAGARLVQLSIHDLLAQRQAAQAQAVSAEAALRNAGVQLGQEVVSPQLGQSTGGMGLPNLMDQMFTNPMASFLGTRQPGIDRGAQVFARGTQVEQARQALSQAASRLQEIDARIRDSKGVAPFAGLITSKLIEVGDTVQPGQPLLVFADPSALQVQADLPARLAPGLREGMPLSARLDAPHGFVPVTVARVFPTADPVRHTVRVKFDLPPGMAVAPGTYAEVLVPDGGAAGRGVLAIPSSSVVSRGGLTMVFTVDDENRADLRFVRLGEPVAADLVRVLSGLKEGDRVVRQPTPGLASGSLVAP